MSDNRLGNIGSILQGGPPRQRQTLVADPRPKPSPSRTERPRAAETTREAGERPRKPRTKTRPGADGQTLARVPVRLDPNLRDLLADAARRRDVALANVVFEAIEEVHGADRFEEVLRSTPPTSSGPTRTAGPLFTRTGPRRTAEAKVTTELRMTAADRETLDNLVTTHGAANRTHLITAALRAHFHEDSQTT